MNYYIRHPESGPVLNPFDTAALLQGVHSGTIAIDSFASSDLGEDASHLQRRRDCDWFAIQAIPEIAAVFPAPPPAQKVTVPPSKVLLVLHSVSLPYLAYSAVTTGRWWIWFILISGSISLFQLVQTRARFRGAL